LVLRKPAHCELILAGLVVAYVGLSVVAYTDFPRRAPNPPLTDLERRGLAVWRGNNCQACHQMYGFGGFLGPDLTNRVTEATPDAEFRAILEEGAREMPAFHMTPADQEAVLAFLRAVNRTGQSQPTPLATVEGVSPIAHFERLADEWVRDSGSPMDAAVEAGLDVWTVRGCGACHAPFIDGKMRAPDLTRSSFDRSVPALRAVLDSGQRNMPPFEMTDGEVEALSAYLEWLSSNRRDLVRLNDSLLEHEEFSWSTMPWFEYK
jgi:nitric oxide reductase subunit C